MNIRQQAIAAYEAKVESEAREAEERKIASIHNAGEIRRENIQRGVHKVFGDIALTMHGDGVKTTATIEGLDNVFFYATPPFGQGYIAARSNECAKDIRSIEDVGELLQMAERNEREVRELKVVEDATSESEPEPPPKPKAPVVRFQSVTIDKANDLHNQGRAFEVHGTSFTEDADYLIIEFTDLWRVDDDDVPF